MSMYVVSSLLTLLFFECRAELLLRFIGDFSLCIVGVCGAGCVFTEDALSKLGAVGVFSFCGLSLGASCVFGGLSI